MKKQADRHRLPSTIQPGDYAYLSTKNLQLPPELSKKLAPRFIGPFEVLQAVGTSSFKLDLPAALHRISPVFHTSLLRKLEGEIPPVHDPIFEDTEGDDLFEVEFIVDERFRRNKKEFLVHWKGFNVYDRTCEPESNLENAQEAISDFY